MPPYTMSELEQTRGIRLFDENEALRRECWRNVISAQCIAMASEGVGAILTTTTCLMT